MKAYLDLLGYILENGETKDDRTNTGTISSFGHQLEFNLRDGFTAVTTKSLAWKGVVSELLWFLEGSSDERRLAEIRYGKPRNELKDLSKYSTIWTDNADNQGKALGYIQPRALSITQGRAVGVAHYLLGGIATTWSFFLARIIAVG